ncbi:MAG TPA: isoprenylcysteine carboxylmethyltransferase family protein [Pyrinomonadaceae bacterium]|nr:isoprenylcysteine carboxylmethyltransferase family protein [Pyrinomonadaceae bacterium]
MSAAEVAVMLIAWGDVRGFLAHGARAGTAVLILLAPFVTCWSESARASRGLRPVKGQWRTLALLELGFLTSSWLVIFCDRRGFLVFQESDALRYCGLIIFTAGFALRIWVFIYLGRFFSVFLTIQKDHRLVTDNVYRFVRHPSYTGLLVRSLGWVLVFRSILGLLIWPCLLVFLVRRMNHEERVLASEFGAKWQEYGRRTPWRLLPGVY